MKISLCNYKSGGFFDESIGAKDNFLLAHKEPVEFLKSLPSQDSAFSRHPAGD
jgi:hypothetical protein